MSTNTVRLHRVLRSTPDRVYRAFVDADAYAKWLPPHGYTAKVHEMDPRVGGKYRMSFTNHTTGGGHTFGGTYLELEPGRRVRYNSRFDDPNLPGEMTTTIDIATVMGGVEVKIVQEGVPSAIPTEMCYLRWQESLVLLAQLVEPDIRQ